MITSTKSPPAIVRQHFDQKTAIAKLKQLQGDLDLMQEKSVKKVRETGKLLLTMKSHLPHGKFADALKSAGITPRTAQNYMLLGKYETVSHLKGLSLSDAYEVAAKAANGGRSVKPKPSKHVILIDRYVKKLALSMSVLSHDSSEFSVVVGGRKKLMEHLRDIKASCARVEKYLKETEVKPAKKGGK